MKRAFGKWFYLAFCFALTAEFTGCGAVGLLTDNPRPTICFVLPNGYLGPFQLILDENTGIEVLPKEGKYTYEISDNGVLRVKTFRPFEVPSKYFAMYRNGSVIPPDDSSLSPDTISLHLLGQSRFNDGPLTQTNVIGTRERAQEVKRDMTAGRPLINKP